MLFRVFTKKENKKKMFNKQISETSVQLKSVQQLEKTFCLQVIMLLWFGGLEAKPDKSRFSDGTLFSSEVARPDR